MANFSISLNSEQLLFKETLWVWTGWTEERRPDCKSEPDWSRLVTGGVLLGLQTRRIGVTGAIDCDLTGAVWEYDEGRDGILSFSVQPSRDFKRLDTSEEEGKVEGGTFEAEVIGIREYDEDGGGKYETESGVATNNGLFELAILSVRVAGWEVDPRGELRNSSEDDPWELRCEVDDEGGRVGSHGMFATTSSCDQLESKGSSGSCLKSMSGDSESIFVRFSLSVMAFITDMLYVSLKDD